MCECLTGSQRTICLWFQGELPVDRSIFNPPMYKTLLALWDWLLDTCRNIITNTVFSFNTIKQSEHFRNTPVGSFPSAGLRLEPVCLWTWSPACCHHCWSWQTAAAYQTGSGGRWASEEPEPGTWELHLPGTHPRGGPGAKREAKGCLLGEFLCLKNTDCSIW